MLSRRDYQQAGRLLHWGLRPTAFPGNEPEYAEALRRYLDDGEFREAFVYFALGLGLEVVEAAEAGLVLAPSSGSLFRVKMAEYRSSTGADDRLIEGFIHVGIAATVFPTAESLEEATTRRRPAIRVDEVEETLRRVCERLAAEAKDEPDPTREEVEAGLIAAWRVYDRRVAKDSGRRRVGVATEGLIEKTLETLTDAGMFVQRTQQGKTVYQPTFRYQAQIAEFSANAAYRMICHLLQPPGEPEDVHA